MKLQGDVEGKQALDQIINAGLRAGAFGSKDLLGLASLQQKFELIGDEKKLTEDE